MTAPQSIPAPAVSLRDLVLGAIGDLITRDIGSTALRDLAAQCRQRALSNGRWARLLDDGIRAPIDEDRRLVELARALALTRIELMTLALLVSTDEDPFLGRALTELQHPVAASRPSLGFVAVAFAALAPGQQALHVLVSGGALSSGLFGLSHEDRPLNERVLSLPPAISLALRGHDGVWPGATIGRGTHPEVPIAPSVIAEAERQARALVDGRSEIGARDEHDRRCLVIRTSSPGEGRTVAAEIARALELRPVFIEGDAIGGLGIWLRLRALLPIFCVELGPGERKQLPALARYEGPVLALAGPDGSVEAGSGGAPEWTLGVPSIAERTALWTAALGPGPLADELAAEHRHGAGRIAHLGRVARYHAQLEGAAEPTRAHVQSAAWIGEGLGLGGLAEPLRAPVPDDALVTTPTLRGDLEQLLLRCRARDGIDDGLGVSLRARYRPGVRALFVGPSGTGKTLAAGWLATRLGVPLYRVDLAAVTSKYIGETEKNLAQLLARAEHAEVVLLFDEADSMFGKRTDVKDANDRFANAQTNYLLQRIESFDGITILTSNSRSRFDSAFARRLDAILDFALPGPEERRGLWLSHLGAAHALPARAVNQLAATIDLSGGHIRNVVLTAAVLAHAHHRPIAYSDVLSGLATELRKLGRQVPQELRAADA